MNRSAPMPLVAPALAALLGACGGGSGSGDDAPPPAPVVSQPSQPPGAPVLADATDGTVALPLPLRALENDPRLTGPLPEVVAVETLADSGLQVAFTDAAQPARIAAGDIGAEWEHMQSCVGVVSPPPLVVVVAGRLRPLTDNDDAIRDLDGRVTASATTGDTATLLISEADFDGSLGSPRFGLRSIMGRNLWLSAGLAERDYPFLCAREAAPSLGR